MVPGSENAHYTEAGVDLHMGNVCILPIVASSRQEICIHRFHISTTGFGEHSLQRHEPLRVPFECKQLNTITIEQVDLWSEHTSLG